MADRPAPPALYSKYRVVRGGLRLERSYRHYRDYGLVYQDVAIEAAVDTIYVVIHIYNFNAVDIIGPDGVIYYLSLYNIDDKISLIDYE